MASAHQVSVRTAHAPTNTGGADDCALQDAVVPAGTSPREISRRGAAVLPCRRYWDGAFETIKPSPPVPRRAGAGDADGGAAVSHRPCGSRAGGAPPGTGTGNADRRGAEAMRVPVPMPSYGAGAATATGRPPGCARVGRGAARRGVVNESNRSFPRRRRDDRGDEQLPTVGVLPRDGRPERRQVKVAARGGFATLLAGTGLVALNHGGRPGTSVEARSSSGGP